MKFISVSDVTTLTDERTHELNMVRDTIHEGFLIK